MQKNEMRQKLGKDQEKFFLHEMSWIEIKEIANEKTVVILPTSSIEQHGPHLPIGTDSYIGYELCKRLGKSLVGKIPFVIAPPMVFGASSHHIDFPGTMSVTTNTYLALIQDLCHCLIGHGFKKIILLNSHGGNTAPLEMVIRNIRDQHKVVIAAVTYWVVATKEITRIRESKIGGIAHAGELETSCMLVIKPHLVNKRLLKRKIPKWRTNYVMLDFQDMGKVNLAQHLCDFTSTGVIGDPTLASEEKGKQFIETITDSLSKFVIEFSTWELGMMTEEV